MGRGETEDGETVKSAAQQTTRQTPPTRFLSAARSPKREIERSRKRLAYSQVLIAALNCNPMVAVLLNENRQIVLANRAALALADGGGPDSVFGLRPGELLNCEHAMGAAGGCGTTEFCTVCGAGCAIQSSQRGEPDTRECRVSRANGDALDLRVWASPFEMEGQTFTFFTVLDITDEKRRRWLERIFFHDLMNSMAVVLGTAAVLKDVPPVQKDEMARVIVSATEEIIAELQAQKELAAAEAGDLRPEIRAVESLQLLRDVKTLLEKDRIAYGRRIVIRARAEPVQIKTDRRLLFRVLGNMVKNALEACAAGDTVTLDCRRRVEVARFSVNNPGVMPDAVRLQIFKRSFSTKSGDRGLGTYSMKLLSERYLKGRVSFTSGKRGVTFYGDYPLDPGAGGEG